MDLLQRLDDGVAQPFGICIRRAPASPALAASKASPARASASADTVRRRSTSAWALRFQLVQDAGQLGHLTIVEAEPVGQEAQRPAHAEAAAEAFLGAAFVRDPRRRGSRGRGPPAP